MNSQAAASASPSNASAKTSTGAPQKQSSNVQATQYRVARVQELDEDAVMQDDLVFDLRGASLHV